MNLYFFNCFNACFTSEKKHSRLFDYMFRKFEKIQSQTLFLISVRKYGDQIPIH
jgi:hypothetical protein